MKQQLINKQERTKKDTTITNMLWRDRRCASETESPALADAHGADPMPYLVDRRFATGSSATTRTLDSFHCRTERKLSPSESYLFKGMSGTNVLSKYVLVCSLEKQGFKQIKVALLHSIQLARSSWTSSGPAICT